MLSSHIYVIIYRVRFAQTVIEKMLEIEINLRLKKILALSCLPPAILFFKHIAIKITNSYSSIQNTMLEENNSTSFTKATLDVLKEITSYKLLL